MSNQSLQAIIDAYQPKSCADWEQVMQMHTTSKLALKQKHKQNLAPGYFRFGGYSQPQGGFQANGLAPYPTPEQPSLAIQNLADQQAHAQKLQNLLDCLKESKKYGFTGIGDFTVQQDPKTGGIIVSLPGPEGSFRFLVLQDGSVIEQTASESPGQLTLPIGSINFGQLQQDFFF